MHQEILISPARFTFLLEVEAQANCEKDKESRKQIDFSWLTLHRIASCSPSASSLTNWVTELAKFQFIIFSAKMANACVFCQSCGGQKGQEVRLFTLWDENDKTQTKHGSICQFWAGLTYTGKTSVAAAA
jgi:putative component of membrane protein insertase Oxa1/YidC/SpoIIIJ protein YidD